VTRETLEGDCGVVGAGGMAFADTPLTGTEARMIFEALRRDDLLITWPKPRRNSNPG